MKRTSLALIAAAALATTLAACGGTGGTVTDATVDEPTEVESTTTDEKDVEKDAKATDDKDAKVTDEAEAANLSDAEKEAAKKKAEADGKTVLVGKVVMVDGPDIFKYESIDPSVMGGAQSEAGNTYAVLELDRDTEISGMGADNYPRTETHDHIGLGHDLPKYDEIKDTASQWKAYDGKRVCVAGDAVFPTDVSFPTAGTLHDAEVLYVE